MAYGSYRDSIPAILNVHIHGKEIKRVEFCKYLGIYIDSYLKWNYHIKEVIRKTNFFKFIFHRLRWYADNKTLRIIYHALFESIVNYGILAWGGCNKTTYKPLLATQNRLIKICNARNDQPTPLAITETFMTESVRYYYQDCKQMYENYMGRSRARQITLPKINKTIGASCSAYVAKKYFNLMPNSLKNLSSADKTIKKHIIFWFRNNFRSSLE